MSKAVLAATMLAVAVPWAMTAPSAASGSEDDVPASAICSSDIGHWMVVGGNVFVVPHDTCVALGDPRPLSAFLPADVAAPRYEVLLGLTGARRNFVVYDTNADARPRWTITVEALPVAIDAHDPKDGKPVPIGGDCALFNADSGVVPPTLGCEHDGVRVGLQPFASWDACCLR